MGKIRWIFGMGLGFLLGPAGLGAWEDSGCPQRTFKNGSLGSVEVSGKFSSLHHFWVLFPGGIFDEEKPDPEVPKELLPYPTLYEVPLSQDGSLLIYTP